MKTNEDLINSCRICRSDNQDGEFYQCLYEDSGGLDTTSQRRPLSEAGRLYEELLETKIRPETMAFFPQYLCNSCDLQMRLFKKLKTRARKTLEILQKLFEAQALLPADYEKPTRSDKDETDTMLAEEEAIVGDEGEQEQEEEEEEEFLAEEKASSDAGQLVEELYEAIEPEEAFKDDYKATEDVQHSPSNESQTVEMVLELENDDEQMEEAKHDYVTEIYEIVDEAKSRIKPLEMYEESSLDTSDTYGSVYMDVRYLTEETNETAEESSSQRTKRTKSKGKHVRSGKTENKRREYKCLLCVQEFDSSAAFAAHRQAEHSNKYPCSECPKLLQSAKALRVHMNLHSGPPAYQCDICQKTFNQKVHYQYHMDGHNNVRKHKCDECGKAFLSKSDLSIHKRFHTGERPYACERCGKDFLLLEHLKMHRYSHSQKQLECSVCKQKFISPSTLRLHMQTIHAPEPRFKCTFCAKRFRRKHHLEAHLKIHQKGAVAAEPQFEIIDDAELLENVNGADVVDGFEGDFVIETEEDRVSDCDYDEEVLVEGTILI